MRAFLILADGHVFEGTSFGATKEVISEIVFNTSMTGYLEILTDPSYAGEAVVMTYPLIGNYGICLEDMEDDVPWPDGFIVRELAREPSNFRSEMTLEAFLTHYDIPGIEGIDTRALTKILRSQGTMNGMITTNEDFKLDEVLPKIRAFKAKDVVQRVTCRQVEKLPAYSCSVGLSGDDGGAEHGKVGNGRSDDGKVSYARPLQVALMDFGAKKNIARELSKLGCDVTIYPAGTSADEIMAAHPDGIMLSNGPGDPKDCGAIIGEVKKLFDSGTPMFGICLGHQLLALANGADTRKMKWGHRGANHPVKDLSTGRVYMSTQNHGYVVADRTVPEGVAEVSFTNANDAGTEGLHYLGKNVFTVQFHPEACGGPRDTAFLFDRFINMMEVCKDAEEE